MPSSTRTSSKTRRMSFAITTTQQVILTSKVYSGRASAIVRVLLQLYFNKQLNGIDIESLIRADLDKATLSEQEVQKYIHNFNERRKAQKASS